MDYVLAARRGFVTNYLDVSTRPVREYVATALAMAGISGEAGAADPDLWRSDVAANDIAAYRHYHPPPLLIRRSLSMLVAAVTAVVTAVRRSRLPPALLPFAIYALAMCVLQVGNQNLKPLYFVSLLPSLAVLSSVWIVDAMLTADRRVRLAGQALAAAVAIAVVFNVQQTLGSPDRSNAAGELMDRLARVEELKGARVLTWPAGSHAAQMLGFYLPSTRFVRVIDEPRNVFAAREAIRSGAFQFVIVDRESGLEDGPPRVLESRYRPFLTVLGESDTAGFEVWRRRE